MLTTGNFKDIQLRFTVAATVLFHLSLFSYIW